jgi:uncharacterized protein DUF1326
MSRRTVIGLAALVATLTWGGVSLSAPPAPPDWSMNATIIEACSCPMFCTCYFNTKPASHQGMSGEEHFCRFNNAFQVNQGHFGATKLDGLKFWVGGDLGAEFSDGVMDWAVLTFEPTATKEQRDAVAAIMGRVYPVKWNSFTVGPDAAMTWTATKDKAEARLGDGKVAEVVLNRFQGNTSDPVVIKNLKYWGTPRNDGFVLMPNAVEAWRAGDKAFEFKNGNGFMITFDITSKDAS